MQKAYVRQNFVNGTDPALDEVDMNKIDSGLSIVDDRVILLDGSKADKTQVFACVNSIIYTISTGILRITYVNGAVQDVNLGLQTTAMSMTENGIITMQDSEGNTYTCDLRNILNSKLSELTDVDVTGIEDGQGIAWDAANRKFVPVDLNPAPGQTVQIPVPKTKTYTYDGTEQTFEWDSIDTTNINVSGNTQTNAGSYTVTATLKSNRDEWSDGTKAAKTFAWTIAKAQSSFVLSESSVLIDSENPTATVNVTDIVGDGEVSAASSDNTIATASYSNGVVTITYVADGSVGVTVAIAETTNYLSASSIISVSNAPAIVQIPVAKSKTYTYNGSAQTFEWDSIDTTNINVSGDVKTNAGTYTVTASLKGAGDTWSDGTTADKTYSWTIGKAQGDFTLSANSASVTESNPTASINVSAITGDGALSVASSDTDVATASYSNGVITITGLDNGNAVITVSLGEGTNYLPVSKQISVAASGFPGSTVTVTLSIESAASDTVYVTGPGLDGTDYITTDSSGSGSGTLDIIPGETYTFTSSVAKALDGSGNDYSKNYTLTNSLSQTVNVSPLPIEYQWVGSLKGNGSNYIDTGINFDNGLHAVFDIIFSSSSNWQLFAGSQNSSTMLRAWMGTSSNKYYWIDNSSGTIYASNSTVTTNTQLRLDCDLRNGTLKINGSTMAKTAQGNPGYVGTNTTYNAYIFGSNKDGSLDTVSSDNPTIKRAWLYNGDTLALNLVPCYRKADNKTGMYDLDSDTFLPNATSTEFTVGWVW